MEELRPIGTDTRAVTPLSLFKHGELLKSDTQVTQESSHSGNMESI